MIRCVLLLATCAYVANAVDIVFSTATATGASKVYGGNYYATGDSLTFNWQTVADNSQAASGANLVATTTAVPDTQTASAIQCYCRLRASQLTFSPAWTFASNPGGGTNDVLGNQDIGSLTATATELADSGLEAYGTDWKRCDDTTQAAATSSHTETYSSLPDGYYTFSVTCGEAANAGAAPFAVTWTTSAANSGATNWLVKLDNVAPSSTVVEDGTVSATAGAAAAQTFDPSPNSGHGWGASQNGIFNFALSTTDYYGTANGAPYTAVQTTGNKATCTANTDCELQAITYLCAVDNGAYAACGGTIGQTGAGVFASASLTAGEHVLRVKAVDKAGNTETYASFYSFSVRPHAKNAGCTFRYDLDSAGYTSLGSTATKTLSGLTDGSHTFGVLAVDSVSNVGTAQSFTWTVDTTPPTATITTTWSAQGNPTSTAGTFAWSFSESGSYSKYSTDGTTYTMPGTLTATTVTLAANTFPIGSRSFKVYGVDLLGNAGSAATDSFTVEPIDTTVSTTSDYACSGTPSAAIKETSVTYSISATIDQAAASVYTYMYKLDSGSWKQGVHFPAFGIKGLSEGVHQLEAKAYTSAGVVDPTPACRKFIIDMTKPVTTITAPGASKQGAAPTFGGKVTDANIQATGGTTYRVEKVGDASFSSVTGSVATATDGSFTITLSTMADGLYQIYVRHTDMAGNVGSETMVEWTVDTAVPNTMVSSGPSSPTASTTASFLFACDESPCTYKYKVDSADNYSSSSTARLNLSSIAPGVHTIEVHAIDVAGNEDLSAAAYTWTVFDATTYASLETSAKFSLNGPTPLEYTPPAENYVHV